MRIVVTGALEWWGRAQWRVMNRVLARTLGEVSELAHGDARGADRMADSWCEQNGVTAVPYPADWRPGGRYDPGAGFRRNAWMLADFRPEQVLAFKDEFDFSLRRGGTENTVKLALAMGVPVEVWNSEFEVVHLPRDEQLTLGSCQPP